jgi:Zn-dependent protease
MPLANFAGAGMGLFSRASGLETNLATQATASVNACSSLHNRPSIIKLVFQIVTLPTHCNLLYLCFNLSENQAPQP